MRDALAIEDLHDDLDAVVVALRPRHGPVLSTADIGEIAQRGTGCRPGPVLGIFPMDACSKLGVPTVPVDPPPVGHMGVLPSSVGPEPVVRLQAGGLAVASVLLQPPSMWTEEDRAYVDPI